MPDSWRARVTLVDLLILAASPAIGWFVLQVEPVQGEDFVSAVVDIFVVVLCGLALVCPFIFLSQAALQKRSEIFSLGEWAWGFQCVIVIVILACIEAKLSEEFWIVIMLQIVSGCIVLTSTVSRVVRLAIGDRPLTLQWSDLMGRVISLSITLLIVYHVFW